jgi:hypothetical protein
VFSRRLRLSSCVVFRSEQRFLFRTACSVQSNVFCSGQHVPFRTTCSVQGSMFRSEQRVPFRVAFYVQSHVFRSEKLVPFRATCSVQGSILRSEQRVPFWSTFSVQSNMFLQNNVFRSGQYVPFGAKCSISSKMFGCGQRVPLRATCSVQIVFLLQQNVPFRATCYIQDRLFLSFLPNWSSLQQIFSENTYQPSCSMRTERRTYRHGLVNSRSAHAPKYLTFYSVNRDKVRYLQGEPLFWAPYHERPCKPMQNYPVRPDRLRSALPPAGFRLITTPTREGYVTLFSATDKVFPQISNLESNKVPVSDPNTVTLMPNFML